MSEPREVAPEVSAVARRTAWRVLEPLERFLHIEAASGVVLLAAAALALAWANSPWGASYDHLWQTAVALTVGGFTCTASLHFLVNDGLMTVFFLVVGLEIRREIHAGELSHWRRATLPVAAALGGMLAPALIYFAVARASPVQQGWAVPMATDIAFAVGVLALLGARIAPGARVLLLALAIIDDIGAIVVIAVVFADGFRWSGALIALLGMASVVALQKLGIRRAWWYVPLGGVIWIGFARSGIHPSMAGVVLGLMTPVRPWLGEATIGRARREAVAPVIRVERALHRWVAFAIMPLFAVANAGVRIAGVQLAERSTALAVTGIVVGLVVGKPLGILFGVVLAVRSGLSALPSGVTWKSVAVVGAVAGVGFTMAIFMAQLAFGGSNVLSAAKLAVLSGSLLSGVGGLLLGRFALLPICSPQSAATADLAEASDSH